MVTDSVGVHLRQSDGYDTLFLRHRVQCKLKHIKLVNTLRTLVLYIIFPVLTLCCLFLFKLQVFTSTSTLVFKTFACDHEIIDGKKYLREDYSLSCETRLHMLFEVYAGCMILVSTRACLSTVIYRSFCFQNGALLSTKQGGLKLGSRCPGYDPS